jgi:hypothetical protein
MHFITLKKKKLGAGNVPRAGGRPQAAPKAHKDHVFDSSLGGTGISHGSAAFGSSLNWFEVTPAILEAV